MEALDLRDITLGVQDWGSLIGLRLAAESPDRFARILLSNGGLPTGTGAPPAFKIWRAFSRYSPWFPIGRIVQTEPGALCPMPRSRPTTRPSRTAAIRQGCGLTPLVPMEPGIPDVAENKRAWAVFEQWHKPFICCFSNGDPITRGGTPRSAKGFPAKDQPGATTARRPFYPGG